MLRDIILLAALAGLLQYAESTPFNTTGVSSVSPQSNGAELTNSSSMDTPTFSMSTITTTAVTGTAGSRSPGKVESFLSVPPVSTIQAGSATSISLQSNGTELTSSSMDTPTAANVTGTPSSQSTGRVESSTSVTTVSIQAESTPFNTNGVSPVNLQSNHTEPTSSSMDISTFSMYATTPTAATVTRTAGFQSTGRVESSASVPPVSTTQAESTPFNTTGVSPVSSQSNGTEPTSSSFMDTSTFSMSTTTPTAATVNGTASSQSTGRVESSTSSPPVSTTRVIEASKKDPCGADLNPCQNHGRCLANGTKAVCTCLPGWGGKNCSLDINECANEDHKCDGNVSSCVNKPGDYVCNCNEGYAQGDTDKLCIDVDECAVVNLNRCSKNEQCKNTPGTFICDCAGKDVYKNDAGDCVRIKPERMKTRLEREFTDDLKNSSSTKYKELAAQIESNVTKDLNQQNHTDIYKVEVVKLERGSIIATVVVLLNSSKPFSPPADYNITNATDSDYCLLNQCDELSTICRGSAELKNYWCSCKDNTYERVQGAAFYCRQKSECSETNPCPAHGDVCRLQAGVYRCMSKEISLCGSVMCQNNGVCISLNNGSTHCSCPDGYSGETCDTKTVKASEVKNLRNILIGVGVGLGSLALFCSIALCIVCCAEKSRGSKELMLPTNHYAADDVTIDTWEPSLPRPKIKPGAFSRTSVDGLEMNERRLQPQREQGAGAENPAFIPDADYDSGEKRERIGANGKKKGSSDYVYF